MVIDGCKMPHNSSFDSMSHFVQDEFQSTNSGDSFKHIQCKSKTYTKHTLNTFLKTHRKHLQNIKSKQKHQKFKNHQTHIQHLSCYRSSFFLFTHHKRDISHFLVVAYPVVAFPGQAGCGT
jgi:hypothetical protein